MASVDSCQAFELTAQGPFAKQVTKRSGRHKKKSLLRLLRSDFWLLGFSRGLAVAILELTHTDTQSSS